MLNADDPITPKSLNLLKRTIESSGRPLVLWLGAGTSRWAGLPSWKDLARSSIRHFSKYATGFNASGAKSAFGSDDFPSVFSHCERADSAMYRDFLVSQLSSAQPGPLYDKLIEKLKQIAPLRILTTNADTLLEQRLNGVDVLERSDIERIPSLIQKNRGLIAKVHGSTSSVQSMVFTAEDYQAVSADSKFLSALREVFSLSSVVFFGYGLRDAYLLRLLEQQSADHSLFGAGPHFVVRKETEAPLTDVHPIHYSLGSHADHRAALVILDYIRQTKEFADENSVQGTPDTKSKTDKKRSAFYISEFLPAGNHLTSQQLMFSRKETKDLVESPDTKRTMTIGLGWTVEDLPSQKATALHDLAVGLICFDVTYLPLHAAGAANNALGEKVFLSLVESGALRFLNHKNEPATMFVNDGLIGDLGVIQVRDEAGGKTFDSEVMLRRIFAEGSNGKVAYEATIKRLLQAVEVADHTQASVIAAMTRSALLMPRVSRLLGFGDAILPSEVPIWIRFPVLRLAHIVQASQICQSAGIPAARLPFGSGALISAAFSVRPEATKADMYASYTLVGRLACSLEDFVAQDSTRLLHILAFRETQAGVRLRSEVLASLNVDDTSQFAICVDAGIAQSVPTRILEAARSQLENLMMAAGSLSPTPAIWVSDDDAENAIRRWRSVARKQLIQILKAKKLKTSDPCICGSGEIVRTCCLRPLAG